MQFWEVILLSVALAMDACAVGMTNGMAESKMPFKKAALIGGAFGFFQFIMPLVGYLLASVIAGAFLSVFESVSAWVSFGLLAFLGGKMLWDAIKEMQCRAKAKKAELEGENATPIVCEFSPTTLTVPKLLMQAVATSIDALAVGVTLKMAELSAVGLAGGALLATLCIGIITFLLSVVAVYIGKALGDKLTDKAELFGGLVLIAIGLKILIESFL